MISVFKKNIKSIFYNRELLKMLVLRDLTAKYKGSYFGFLWSFINPLLLIGLYSLVFGLALKIKWIGIDNSELNFTVMLFSGLIFYLFLSESFVKSTFIITNNPNYVKKVLFPLEILIWTNLISSLVQFIINLALFLIIVLLIEGFFPTKVLVLPIIFLPLFLMASGISFLFATINVFFRDISQIVSFVSTLFLFLSPVFYPIKELPLILQYILKLNPITIPIIEFRNQVFFNTRFDYENWTFSLIFSIIVFSLSYKLFENNKKKFSDEL